MIVSPMSGRGCGANCYRIWCLLLSNMYPCLYFCRILLIFRVSTSLAEYGRIRLGYASGYVVSKISPHSCIGYTHDLTACYPILSEILDMRGYGTDMTRILHGYGRRYMNTPPPELTLNENGGNHSFLRLVTCSSSRARSSQAHMRVYELRACPIMFGIE